MATNGEDRQEVKNESYEWAGGRKTGRWEDKKHE
jgi:hypothetical protein